MKRILFALLFTSIQIFAVAQPKEVRPVKNVILMIPDGTSLSVVSAARWYQTYKGGAKTLNIDPYICGTVTTFCSNAPIGDSAPTTSCYMTGVPARTGNVSIYPLADGGNDIIPLDPSKAYQPQATVLEAAKYQQNKATGLVVTVEFPHATPADCSAHHYNRNKYEFLAPQIAYNNLDVMFGGGNKLVTDDMKQYLKNTNTTFLQDDINAFRKFNGNEKIWALFGEMDHPYDIDRDDSKIPSLAEMTKKAIERLSKNENGFFLMVEGSKVDWLAHDNDAVGVMTEYLAFDKAVGAALDFAKKDGETVVIILPDHGNSGFSIGRRGMSVSYSKASLNDLFENVSKYQHTAYWMEQHLLEINPSDIKSEFKKYTGIDLTDDELNQLMASKNYKKAENYMEASNSVNMHSVITNIMNSRTSFGFTTGGHTGEEVFLAAYHPQGDVPQGRHMNVDINTYLTKLFDFKKPLPEMTDEIFAKHTDVFSGLKYEIIGDKANMPTLVVTKGKKKLEIPAFKSVVTLNKKPISLKSVVVYIDKNETFYLPKELKAMLD